MSDPMTNTEVEDVLASIRRLVSDDKRPEAAVQPKTPADRLVLTPSLRVMEENDSQMDTVDEEVAQDTPEDAQPAIEERTFDDSQDNVAVYEDEHVPPVAEPDDAQDTEQEDARAEAVAGELEAMDLAHNDTASEATATPEAEETSAELMPELSEDAPSADGQGDSALDADLDADALFSNDIAQDVTAPEDWAQEVDTLTEPTVEIEGEPSLNMEVPAEILSTDAEADDIAPDTSSDANASAQSLGEKIAALETLVGNRRETFEPDDPGADAYAGTEAPAMEWEDAEEAPAADVFADAPPEHAEEPQAQLFSSEEDVLDEEALRELVSDIVREELQGVLGERITRNVRKLVRREIHRALAAQDLE